MTTAYNQGYALFRAFSERHRAEAIDFTHDGQCSGCGGCCSNALPTTDAEIKRIRRHVWRNKITAQKHLALVVDDICPFRDSARQCCTIYDIRPSVCRDYLCRKYKHGEMPAQEIIDNAGNCKIVDARETIYGRKGK